MISSKHALRIVGHGLAVFWLTALFCGCQKDAAPVRGPMTEGGRVPVASGVASVAHPRQSPGHDVLSSEPRPAPLVAAYRAYQQAYDKYVRSLRESGPQTMETLQALAEYQKNYQVYQMLKNAENTPVSASSEPSERLSGQP